MTERISPFHCPYCAEENLWPREPEGWESRMASEPGVDEEAERARKIAIKRDR